jgi:hypothetical protein
VRPDQSPEWGSILMKERESGPRYTYALYQHHDQTSAYFEETEEGVLISPEHSLPSGAWTHLAITDDGAHSRLYENGKLVYTAAALPIEGHGEIRIGGNDIWGEFFDGRIDEVRIYERALNSGEVDADMEAPLVTPKRGPVAEYSFDANGGSTVADLSGNKNEGTIEGATWTPQGRYGSALEFNSESCVSVPDSESLQLHEEFTLETWVRPTGSPTDDPILFKEREGDYSYFLSVGFGNWGRPAGFAEGEELKGPSPLHTDVWTHLAYTYDGGWMRLYVNGEEVESRLIGNETLHSEGPLYIGCDSPAWEDHFRGRIDEMRLYDRALNPGEVDADMETPIQTPRQGPIAAWSFDEGEGTSAEDVTGYGHEATLEGGPIWTKGRYGDALDFNGPTEKCAKVPDSPTLQLREDFTIEAWVKPEGSPEEDPIIWKETGSAASYTLALGLSGGNKAEAYIGEEEGASYERAVSPSSIESNVWTHIAATYDGHHLRLYVNGELVDTTYTSTPNMASTGPLYIGCAPDFDDWFAGRIDEVRLFERALTPAEVAASMSPLPRIETAKSIGVNPTNAVLTGYINPHGLETTYWFEYGPTEAYGSTGVSGPEDSEEVLEDDEARQVTGAVTGLEPETTYHYRVVALNKLGIVAGKDHTFTTGEPTFSTAAAWTGELGLNYAGSIEKTGRVKTMELLEESGSKVFRVVIGQGGAYDLIFRRAAEHGIRILPDIVGVAGYGNLIPPVDPGKTTREAWDNKLTGIIERYGQGGSFWTEIETENVKRGEEGKAPIPILVPEGWEIWNEPNTGKYGSWPDTGTASRPSGHVHPGVYGQLLSESAAVIHAVAGNSADKILMGGLLSVRSKRPNLKAHPHAEDHIGIVEFIEDAGHINAYDALSLHPYAFKGAGKNPVPHDEADIKKVTERVQENMLAARAALDEFGTTGEEIPIWVTEFGWPVNNDGAEPDGSHLLVSEEMQRDLLTATVEMMKGTSHLVENVPGLSIPKIVYYNVEDWVNELPPNSGPPTGWDSHCGLVEDSGAYGEHGAKRKAWGAFVAQAK